MSGTIRRALVLGGTTGLGRASAGSLVAAGSEVTITGRDLPKARAAAGELGGSAEALQLDLQDVQSVSSFCNQIAGMKFDQLVLNSGGPMPGSAKSLSSRSVGEALQFLLLAQIDVVSSVLPWMCDSGWGRIVGIGSSGIQQPIPTLALSNIGRAGLSAYLKSLATDLGSTGITVNMVLPGRIDTARVASLDAVAAERTGTSIDDIREASEARIPMGRYGTPAEFGSAVAYLCSEAASFITGEQLRVDGGMVGSY